MTFGEYDYETDIRVQRQEAKEEGLEEGLAKGIEEGIEQGIEQANIAMAGFLYKEKHPSFTHEVYIKTMFNYFLVLLTFPLTTFIMSSFVIISSNTPIAPKIKAKINTGAPYPINLP